MDYRNATTNADGTIDCEIEHPRWGWIPFTASPDDCESFGRQLHAHIVEQGAAAPYIPPAE